MAEMTKRERVKSALAGGAVDRVPVGFWRHWPGDDQREDSLALVTLEFQRTYDLDFIKLPVSSAYTVSDYGVKHAYQNSPGGDRAYLERVIKRVEDWDRIEPLDIRKGVYGWHLRSLHRVIREKTPDTPVIVTMFNPLALAFYLAGEETCLAHLRTYPERVETALKALTQTCADFARGVIDEGADGIFLSARFASYELMSEMEYKRFGTPGDLTVLAAASGGWFNVLHVHGQHPMLPRLASYPAHALNWHDRTTRFDLQQASKIFKGALMGGIDQQKVLQEGSPEDVTAQVHDAVRQMNGRRLIVTPGCTYSIGVPHANLVAMRRAVETATMR
ncbi:MAG: uroporphyrinogen decarboxylase family protein [Dehalococcoidia bacterium]|nr:uroporphyrinogen decarboxylase family protein [Dehalococcoidia bacterium]